MSLIDRRIEYMKSLEVRLQTAPTFCDWLSSVDELQVLQRQLRSEEAEMRRLAQGWTYVPPPKLR